MRQLILMFALSAQWLAAGGENVDIRSTFQDIFRDCRGCFDNVFTVIEHEKHAPILKKGQQIGNRVIIVNGESECRNERVRNQQWIADAGQVDEVGTLWKCLAQMRSSGERERCLS